MLLRFVLVSVLLSCGARTCLGECSVAHVECSPNLLSFNWSFCSARSWALHSCGARWVELPAFRSGMLLSLISVVPNGVKRVKDTYLGTLKVNILQLEVNCWQTKNG